MQNRIVRKSSVSLIILLFFGLSVTPHVPGEIGKNNDDLCILDNEPRSLSTVDWWPMFHHDLNNSGYSTADTPETNTVAWSYTTGYWIYSSPAVSDGKVYIGSDDDKVYCLDADDGTMIWSYTTGDWVDSSPAVCDGKVYIGSLDHKVYCLDAVDGTMIWNYSTGDWVDSSPAVYDSKVYIGSFDNKVYCLDADDGTEIWTFSTGGSVDSSPAVCDGKVYIGSFDNNVYCLNSGNGSEIWNYTTGSDVRSSPAVCDGKVYIGSLDHKVYCFENHRPDEPTIEGPTSGKAGIEHCWTFNSTDPDDDYIYYYIDWRDDNIVEWEGPYPSSIPVMECHIFEETEDYTIRAKAKDIYGAESNWAEFKVEIIRNKATYNSFFQWLLERFPMLERLLTLSGVI